MIYVDGSSAALALITILFMFFIYLPYNNRKTRKNSIKKLKNDVASGKKSLSLIDYALLDKKDIEKALGDEYSIRFYDSGQGEKAIYNNFITGQAQTTQKSATNFYDKEDEFIKDYLSSYNYKKC